MLKVGELVVLSLMGGMKEYGPFIVRKEITNAVVDTFRKSHDDPHVYSFRNWLKESGYLEDHEVESRTWELGHMNEFSPDEI